MKMLKVIRERGRAIKAAMSAAPPETISPAAANSTETRKRIRRVTLEAERTMIFRSRSSHATLWCPRCDAEVEMLSVAAAARQAGITELAIYDLIESGTVHFAEDGAGRVFICLDSLGRQMA